MTPADFRDSIRQILMPYDYARERDDAKYDDGDDEQLDPRDFQDEEPPRYGTPYRCSDRMCGALDCSNCNPGGCDEEPNE